MTPDQVTEVIEGDDHSTVVLTCEHASNAIPDPWRWPPDDLWLTETHWAFDLGIAEVTRVLAQTLRAPAVLARFSRLLVDPNRPANDPTLFRALADGHPVRLNQDLTEHERAARLAWLHEPYHAQIDAVLARCRHALVLSMHSFTPIYENGPPRPMQIGVLFDREDALAGLIAESLARDGFVVALNEPYSGKDGLIYAAERHATRHGRQALELEVRQDLAVDPVQQRRIATALRHALEHAGVWPAR